MDNKSPIKQCSPSSNKVSTKPVQRKPRKRKPVRKRIVRPKRRDEHKFNVQKRAPKGAEDEGDLEPLVSDHLEDRDMFDSQNLEHNDGPSSSSMQDSPSTENANIVPQEVGEVDVLNRSEEENSLLSIQGTTESESTMQQENRDVYSSPNSDVINALVEKTNSDLPERWKAIADFEAVHIFLFSTSYFKAVQREIICHYNGHTEIGVHCHPLPSALCESILKNVHPPISLTSETIEVFAARCCSLIRSMNQFTICVGANLPGSEVIWPSIADSYIDLNPFHETSYETTCRSNKCARFAPFEKRFNSRCVACKNVNKILTKRLPFALKEKADVRAANTYLTPLQAQEKLRALHKENRKKDKKIERLTKKVNDLLAVAGTDVDDGENEDLLAVLKTAHLTEIQHMFLKQQLEASSKTDSRGHRWHPAMIRLALHIRMVSPAAYEAIRDSGVIKLPSSRTLYDYSNFIKPTDGISHELLKLVSEQVNALKTPQQKYHALLFDEIHISKNLVYRSSDGSLVGYIHLNEVEKEIATLEKIVESQDRGDENVERETEPVLASKILAFMVKGLCSSVKCVVASYPCVDMCKEMLYSRCWDVLSRLEIAGIKVLALVCDGHPVNRGFFNLHVPITKTDTGIIFDTVNFSSPERRPLYFVSDVCHLIKTARNCFYQSGEGPKKTRCLRLNGETIEWKTIVRLYLSKKSATFQKAYKLGPQHVYPNSYSCMKVKYAAQVLSATVASDIKIHNWPNTKETVRFIRKFDAFFDMLNGAHSSQHTRKNNPYLAPYNSEEDYRFEKLNSFLNYLADWKKQSEALNLPPSERDKTMLSHQTLAGIEISVRAITAAIKFLLKEGSTFVMARAFSQDPLEHHFSRQRSGLGGSTNPNALQFMKKQISVAVQGQLGVKHRRGNVEDEDERMSVMNEPLPKRRRVRKAREL